MSRPARVAGVREDLLAGQVGFRDDPARIVQEPMRGSLDHRWRPARRRLRLRAAYSRPSPASSSISMQRQQEGDGALGALVQVRRLLAEAVAAARGRRVVDGGAEAVGAQKPRERLAHAPQVAVVARHEVRAPEREHERRGVGRLLVGVGARRRRARASPRCRSGRRRSSAEADRLEKVERLARDVAALRIPRERVRAPERERQQRVVVGQASARTSASPSVASCR